jgi:hypothetical protein
VIRLPPTAWLDNRWNTAMDLAAQVPISPAGVAAVWGRNGPDRTLAALREMTAAGTEPGAA